ncbi:MAG: uracil-DNA glycosylase [Spirochaetes bacterium]|nr:uracil-DNA glycosylase [Spirochaetota bacterium]
MRDIRLEYVRLVHDTIDCLESGFRTKGRVSYPRIAGDPHEDKASRIREISSAVVRCSRCGLSQGRLHAVPGEGNVEADVIFIGEGPGSSEDRQGKPFVGRAGQLLTKMLAAIDLRREEVFITNVVKCRPPQNRTPLPEEIAHCFPYLERQIEIIDPLVICCLGGPAANTVLGSSVAVSRLRGTLHQYRPDSGRPGGLCIPVIVTYHPAAVLRFPEKYRRPVWNDLKLLRDYYRDIKTVR